MEQEIKQKTILLVEDNIAHSRLIHEALKNSTLQHRTLVLKNGVEALEYLRSCGNDGESPRPDIILLDLNLPKMNGIELLSEIKNDPKLKRIPVLMLTTSPKEEDILRSYDLHVNCYVRKSRNLNDLFNIVRKIEEFWLETATLPSE
jgi:chemotaxis family two-component system response regulator Rcp1